MADKVSSGQGIPRSASLWNNIIDSANDFAMRRLGSGGGSVGSLVSTDIVKIRNSSGAAIRQGELLEISGFLLTDLVRDSLWFEGDVPNSVRPFGIALQDMPIDTIDRCQVSGVCIALVNVSDDGHGYAEVVSGDAVLHSTGTGPVRILYKPAGTGEKVCAVLLGGAGVAVDCNTVRFIVQSYTPSTRTAVGYVLSKPPGCASIPDSFLGGRFIEICDPQGCHFNRPSEEIMDSHGWARYQMPLEANICQPDPNYLIPQWEVVNLCCHVPSCET
jgi:hypothetical protein